MELAQITTYFVNGFLILFLMAGAITIVIRNPKNRLFRNFFWYYFCFSAGFLINIIQRLLDLVLWNTFFNRMTMLVITFGLVFLLNFNLILAFDEKFTRKQAWVLIGLWLLVCIFYLFVDLENGTHWLVSVEYKTGVPYWSLTFVIFSIIVNQSMFLIIFIVSIIAKRRIGPDKPKAKHFSKNLAIIFYDWFMIGNILNNWSFMRDNITWFSTFLFYSSFLALPGIILFWLFTIRKS